VVEGGSGVTGNERGVERAAPPDADFYRALVAGTLTATLVCDPRTTVMWCSAGLLSWLGTDEQGFVGTALVDALHPEDRPSVTSIFDQIVAVAGAEARTEARIHVASGDWRACELRLTNALDDESVNGLILSVFDISERRALEDALHTREQFLRAVLESAHEGVWVLDGDGRTAFANRRMSEMLRVPTDVLLAHPIDDLVDAELAVEIRNRLARHRGGVGEIYELRIRPQRRSEMWVSVSAAPLPAGFTKALPEGGVIAFIADITDRKAYEEALQRQQLFDPLTGLPNRALFDVQLKEAIERHQGSGEHFAYLLCDIDGLKLINDALGANQGDDVIREIARRLADAVRPGDCVARTSGDQFVVIAADVEAFQAEQLARDLTAAVHGAFDVDGSPVWPSISVGTASTSDVPAYAVASAADAALHRAKRQGGGFAVLFNAAAPRDHRAALEMLADLREAITLGSLQMHYQPIVRLSTNEVIAAEALMRWHRPGHGEVPPSVFVPLAEEAGLIGELGAWALRQACHDAALWPGRQNVSVNLSARQLTDDLVDTVRETLRMFQLQPERLWLEVTETAVFADAASAADLLRRLADLGVRISLDDFGTGYSSIVYLRDLPVHAMKIDRTFVTGLDKNYDDTAIVTTLINLAASLNVRMVAEGIETLDQIHSLRRLGCEYGQGFVWRPALPTDEFVACIAEIERDAVPRARLSRHPRGSLGETTPAVLARVLAMHRQGASPASIAAALNQDGVAAPGGKRWHRVTVAQLVSMAARAG
jgi:diguanylate cyclase (GGDEF)-like protein/PAS domain S-box-containing protein